VVGQADMYILLYWPNPGSEEVSEKVTKECKNDRPDSANDVDDYGPVFSKNQKENDG